MSRFSQFTYVGVLTFGLAVARVATVPAQRPSEPLAAAGVATPDSEKALIDKYCVGCHNDRTKSGSLSLANLDLSHIGDQGDLWERVVRKVRARHMPPVGRPRPDEASYDRFVSFVEGALDAKAATSPNPGRTDALHRLNRTEYRNAIRDLLALDIDVTALLPKDDASYGFDNIGGNHFSATLLDRYMSAAQKISRLSVGTPLPSPGSLVVSIRPDVTQERHVEGLGFGTRGGALVPYVFPRNGEYEIKLLLARNRDEYVEGLFDAHQVEVAIDGQRVQVFKVEPDPPGGPNEYKNVLVQPDAHLHLRVTVTAGPHEIAVGFIKRTAALFETEREPYHASFNMDRHNRPQPAISSVSIAGPFVDAGIGDTPSRQRIFSCRPSGPADEERCAKTILSTLAHRAFRRPLADADVKMLLGFYQDGRAEGGFEDGIENAIRGLLVSPEFLARVEKDPPAAAKDSVYRISDLNLASRLSFFLWSSIPDDQLLAVAEKGTLHEPAELRQQVKRMLADDRAHALVNSFAEQWLYLRNLEAITPDMRLFPDFDDNLRQAFLEETRLFFESIVQEDRSAIDLLNANYTFLNERLAKHYGIPGVVGSRFRRVTLPPDSHRGGLFGQGSILTVTSYGNRTSPVMRGKWVMGNVLGLAPPPPPPDVPTLPEASNGEKVLSMRERMAEHRANPACAGCHNLMDPIGLSMENFDAVGRWRERDDSGAAIDAKGGLPDGSKFDGVAGFKQALLAHPDAFVSVLTERLLAYGLGRGLESYDQPTVRRVVRDARTDNYRFSSLIEGIVASVPFEMRRAQ